MDYFQGVVAEYLRADRACFLNPECLIQLDEGVKSPAKGRSWYCDIVAVDLRKKSVWLCEVTYSKDLSKLLQRLAAWHTNWDGVRHAIYRDCRVPEDFFVSPWAFVPKGHIPRLKEGLSQILAAGSEMTQMPYPRIRSLETVTPWRYQWNRTDDDSREDQ